MNIYKIEELYNEEFSSIAEWNSSLYQSIFSEYFSDMNVLYNKMLSDNKQITDSELEIILTNIPLKLYAASEKLNELKLRVEVIKLHIKQDKHNSLLNSEASSQVAKREEASYSVLEDELLLKAYTSLIERIENEISFSKELIMSAKKIWTSRKEAENVGKSAENVELPDYINDPKAYIK